MSGAITADDKTFVEKWQNVAEYTNVVIRLDARGDEKPELITGEREFTLTTEERLITQGKIVDIKNDPFLNGSFRPLIVPESVTIESNPNALGEEEIAEIFASSDLAFGEWLANLDSPATLDRMLRQAEASDDLTVKRLRMIRERHEELHPKKRLTTSDEELAKFIGHRAPQGSEQSGGGRSRAYRP